MYWFTKAVAGDLAGFGTTGNGGCMNGPALANVQAIATADAAKMARV